MRAAYPRKFGDHEISENEFASLCLLGNHRLKTRSISNNGNNGNSAGGRGRGRGLGAFGVGVVGDGSSDDDSTYNDDEIGISGISGISGVDRLPLINGISEFEGFLEALSEQQRRERAAIDDIEGGGGGGGKNNNNKKNMNMDDKHYEKTTAAGVVYESLRLLEKMLIRLVLAILGMLIAVYAANRLDIALPGPLERYVRMRLSRWLRACK